MMEKINTHKKYIVIAFLLLCLSFGITLALSKSHSNTLVNSFTPGSIETVIEEEDPKPNGDYIAKAPFVTNVGENDALVRMKVVMSPSELVEKYGIQLTMNQNWTYHSDGYYYYNEIVKPNEATQPLFTKVTGNNIVVNGQINSGLEGLEIAVYHEAVQNLMKDGDQVIQAQSGNDRYAQQIWNLFDSLNK